MPIDLRRNQVFTEDRCCGPNCPDPGWVTVSDIISSIPVDGLSGQVYLVDDVVEVGSDLEGHENTYMVVVAPGNYRFCDPTSGDKVTVMGSCDILCFDGDVFTTLSFSGSPTTYTAINLNTNVLTSNIFFQISGNEFQFYGLRAGTGIALTPNAGGYFTISNTAPSSGDGEANTASNIGPGAGLFASKVGVDLRFKSLEEGTHVTLTEFPSSIRIDVEDQGNTASNVGSGARVYQGIVGIDLRFRRINGTGVITVTENADDITISSTAQNNDATNIGGGAGIYSGKVGSTFQLRTLVGAGIVDASVVGDTIEISINDEADLVTSDGGGDAQIIIAGGPPFVLRDLTGTSTISVVQTGNEIVFTGLYSRSSMGTGADGVEIMNTVSANLIRPYRMKGAGGIVVTQSGNSVIIDGSGVTGGGGGGLLGGGSMVATYGLEADDVAVDQWGDWTDVPMDDAGLTSSDVIDTSNIIKTFVTTGTKQVIAQITMAPRNQYDTAHWQVRHEVRLVIDEGSGYDEVPYSNSFVYSPSEQDDENSLSRTWTFDTIATAAMKVQVRVRGGTVVPYLKAGYCSLQIESKARGVVVATTSGTTQTMAVNTEYIPSNAALTTYTLPTVSAVGDRLSIIGNGAGGWRIAQAIGHRIVTGAGGTVGTNSTTTGTLGHIDSTARYNTVELVCVAANSVWVVKSATGAIAFT